MALPVSGTAATPLLEHATLAFHFRYIQPGEWIESQVVDLDLLGRVIRAVRPNLSSTGSLSLILRMDKLVYTQDFDRSDWNELANALPLQRLRSYVIKKKTKPTGTLTLRRSDTPDRRRLELAFDAMMEYAEDLPELLDRLGLNFDCSMVAMRSMLRLLEDSKLPFAAPT